MSSALAGAPRLALRQLRDQNWLLPTHERVPEFRAELDSLFAQAGYAPKIMLELDDDAAASALIAAGLGIGLIPGLAAPAHRPGVAFVPMSPRRLRTLYAITNSGPLGRPTRTLITQLEAAGSRLSSAAS